MGFAWAIAKLYLLFYAIKLAIKAKLGRTRCSDLFWSCMALYGVKEYCSQIVEESRCIV